MLAGVNLFEGYRAILRAVSFQASFIDQLAIEMSGQGPLPPAYLRSRVHGTPDLGSFVQVGRQCAQDISAAVQHIGRDITGFRSILDFGCGCGRALIYLRRLAPLAAYYGTDIDAEAVGWCARNLPAAGFTANQAKPPLQFSDNQFDLIYAISVFTHLDEQYQFLWLEELQRIAQPGGIVLITLHGYERWKSFPPEWIEKIEKDGMAFLPTSFWKGIFPEWYQNSYHKKEYVYDQFSRYFNVLGYLPLGLNHFQDIVILEKRDEEQPSKPTKERSQTSGKK